MLLQSINPATGETLRSFPALTEEALRERIGLATAAAAAHAALPMEDRSRCLRKLAQLLTAEQNEIARTIALETGKPIRSALTEVLHCAQACSYYAEHAARFMAREVLQVPEGDGRKQPSYLSPSPLGVVLAVMPWESPLLHACRTVLPALAAGNAVLMKHAGAVPQCSLLLETLVRRAGFLRGTVNALLMEDRLVEAALHDGRVSAVSAIGVESVGRALAAQAGWLTKPSSLHLLGNGATVVMPSADMDGAIAAAVDALSSGTEAGKRLILYSGIYNDFVHRLVNAVEALPVGEPLKDETAVGPLGSEEALQALGNHVEAAVKAHGRVLTGGTRLVGDGNFFEPTLLSDVPRDSAILQEVLTGPVAMVMRARDLTDAISLANSSPHAGESSVWTREPAEQQQLLAAINSKSVTLNGSSREGARPGMAALREFTVAKIVTLG